ncbi:CBS domain-containing protein [Methanocrinis sp.]|uniref:CBS domain-containing protein n=1 Tax=Methanocrinis sp. TaxID=3101522 RepID=UPI003D1160A0
MKISPIRMELTQIQREILTALINLQRRESRAIKGEEIASIIDRNPGTIRNQMQSLKALHLVEGVPGPKGGYRAITAAYEAINLDGNDDVVDVPVIRNGSPVEGATANEITFYTVMRPNQCSGIVQIIGNIREFNVDDEIEIGPTPVNKTHIKGVVTGRDDTTNRLLFDIKEMTSIPKIPVKNLARPAITIDPDLSLLDACKKLVDSKARAALVGKNGDLRGLISMEDVVRGMAEGKEEMPVEALMERAFPSVKANEPLHVAISKLGKTGDCQVVVVDSDVPTGILEATDLIRYMIRF